MALLLVLLLSAAPARAMEVAEVPRVAAVPAMTLPAGGPAGLGVLNQPSLSISDVLSWRRWIPGAAVPGLPFSAPLSGLAGGGSQAAPAPLPSEAAGALPALGARVVPDGVSSGRLPASAAAPASLPQRFSPSPLTGGTEAELAASRRRQPGLSALSQQAAQTLADVRALPAAAPNEGAWRLARRLWDGASRRGGARAPRLDDAPASPGSRAAAARKPEAAADGGPSAPVAEAAALGSPSEGSQRPIVSGLSPAGPFVIGRRVPAVEGALLSSGSDLDVPRPASAARPPVALVALRVAGQSLELTERLEPVPVSPAAASATLAVLPVLADGLAAATSSPVAAAPVSVPVSVAAAPAAAAASPASAGPALGTAPAELWALAETAPVFDAGDPGFKPARVPQPSEASLSPLASSGRAASQPWPWLFPVALLAFRYRREFL